MKKITPRQMDILRYRKERLHRKAGQLERLLTGREQSLPPLLRTPTGRYSEARTQLLLGRLAQACPAAGLDGEFFRSFLYCALRLAERGPSLVPGPGFEWGLEGSFEDLEALAASVDPCGDGCDRWYQEFCGGGELPACFALMDGLFERFCGQPIERALAECLPGLPARAAARYQLPPADQEPEGWEEWEECLPADMTDEEVEELDALNQAAAQEAEQWVRAFPAKEAFCQAYLACRRRYFAVERCRGLARAVEEALDLYLYQTGASRYLEDEDFFAAYGLLERSAKQLRALLEEE